MSCRFRIVEDLRFCQTRQTCWRLPQFRQTPYRPRLLLILIAAFIGVAIVRKLLAEGVFKVPLSTIRVLTHDVGGGFGMKAQCYPEYAATCMRRARSESRSNGATAEWRAFFQIRMGEMAFWRQSSRWMRKADFRAIFCRCLGKGQYTSQRDPTRMDRHGSNRDCPHADRRLE